MERIVWLLTFIPARVILILLVCFDFYILDSVDEELIKNSIWSNQDFLITLAAIVCAAMLCCAIVGGKIGYKYVEMGRSRRWHYRATKYDDYNDQLHNALYWAGKFACFPVIVALIVFLTWEVNCII